LLLSIAITLWQGSEASVIVNALVGSIVNSASMYKYPGSVGPVYPVTPVDPVEPVTPVDPVEPVTPVAPVEPVAPVDPVELVVPEDPVEPVAPV
jgi:hypothetical protein